MALPQATLSLIKEPDVRFGNIGNLIWLEVKWNEVQRKKLGDHWQPWTSSSFSKIWYAGCQNLVFRILKQHVNKEKKKTLIPKTVWHIGHTNEQWYNNLENIAEMN